MNEPQIWTLIGVFAAGMFGMIGLMSSMFVRIIRTEIGSVRTDLRRVEQVLSGRIDNVEQVLSGRIDNVEQVLSARIDNVEQVLSARIELLGRDVSAISRRVFGDPPAA